ncbi:ribosome maturation factor RimM [Cytobacillus firmus]|uniref:Ribosome maturation factor RimM n=1 Tax=Cytobacillus firmus DS1 TaxID=1307436 RepID=W7L0P2_CYTFI|nr:ribosome maturation factor RimM [Cytobacillus firmus]EWG11933.1 16S rRNA-processing protein RimM [Cytobacillus firmus DS1]
MQKWFNVGKIVNTHGIKGEARVISKTDFAEDRYKPGNKLYLFMPDTKGDPIELTVKSHRTHKSFDLLTFEGYENINQIEKMKGGILKISEEQLGDLEEDEFYYHEIIGCTVETLDGEEVGKIKEILSPGANDVWVIKAKGGKEILIPYIEDVVKEVNVEDKLVKINAIEGLLS